MNERMLVAKLVGEVAGSFVPFSSKLAEEIVQDLLQVQDEQLTLLNEIQQSVSLLRDGPYETALIYLNEAALEGRTPQDRREKLNEAARCLREAIGLQPKHSMERAQISLDLSIVLAMLEDRPGAVFHATRAYWQARDAMWSVVQANVDRSGWPRRGPSQARVVEADRWFVVVEECVTLLCETTDHSDYSSEWTTGTQVDVQYLKYKRWLLQITPQPSWREFAQMRARKDVTKPESLKTLSAEAAAAWKASSDYMGE